MILYKKLDYLAQRIRYEATYQEMKYYLSKILKGERKESYLKWICNSRNIGKSCALARLSVKYNIPVAVPFKSWETLYKKDIPEYIPKYFKKGIPRVIVVNEFLRGQHEDTVLVEECIDLDKFNSILRPMGKYLVGYKSI